MELLRSGRSNAEIAHTLHVSIETVRTHARRVYRKLGVGSRRELRAM
jgi:DNA-binding CsgD family transcriptional regulator